MSYYCLLKRWRAVAYITWWCSKMVTKEGATRDMCRKIEVRRCGVEEAQVKTNDI
jgi:hypothetical protein